jgi:hypothetical protein
MLQFQNFTGDNEENSKSIIDRFYSLMIYCGNLGNVKFDMKMIRLHGNMNKFRFPFTCLQENLKLRPSKVINVQKILRK